MRIKPVFAALLALPVIGCASPLRVETVVSGAPIAAGSHYVWFVPETEQPHLPEAARTRIARALAVKGLTPAGAGEQADYLLLVNHARRPANVGLAVTDPPPTPGSEPDWLTRPAKHHKQRSSLQFRLLDPATGREISQFSAQASHGKRDAPIVLDRLIDGALAAEMEGGR